MISDEDGESTGTISYFAFGLTRSSTGTLSTDKKFTGQRLDDATGLYYYGARYYDPEIGSFISADTIVPNPANPQSFNRYSYCSNNPLKYSIVDQTGNDLPNNISNTNALIFEYWYTGPPKADATEKMHHYLKRSY